MNGATRQERQEGGGVFCTISAAEADLPKLDEIGALTWVVVRFPSQERVQNTLVQRCVRG